MSPVVVHVAPHPDDEAVGCPASLLHLHDRGWTVVSVIASLGFEDQHQRRRAEAEEAASRAGFVPVFLDPPLTLDLDADLDHATHRIATELPPIVEEHQASIVVSPSPHDVHHGHEAVGRGVQRALAALPTSVRWWMWGVGRPPRAQRVLRLRRSRPHPDRPHPRCLRRRTRTQRLPKVPRRPRRANAVMGSERVFGFGSPAASTLPYAELLTEVCLVDGRFVASHPHALDEGREPGPSSSVDLTPWLDSPSVHELIGRIREVRDA